MFSKLWLGEDVAPTGPLHCFSFDVSCAAKQTLQSVFSEYLILLVSDGKASDSSEDILGKIRDENNKLSNIVKINTFGFGVTSGGRKPFVCLLMPIPLEVFFWTLAANNSHLKTLSGVTEQDTAEVKLLKDIAEEAVSQQLRTSLLKATLGFTAVTSVFVPWQIWHFGCDNVQFKL